MFNQSNKIQAGEITGGKGKKASGKVNSFKNIRKARRKNLMQREIKN